MCVLQHLEMVEARFPVKKVEGFSFIHASASVISQFRPHPLSHQSSRQLGELALCRAGSWKDCGQAIRQYPKHREADKSLFSPPPPPRSLLLRSFPASSPLSCSVEMDGCLDVVRITVSEEPKVLLLPFLPFLFAPVLLLLVAAFLSTSRLLRFAV